MQECSGFKRQKNFEQLSKKMKQSRCLPVVNYEALHSLLLGSYQLNTARHYLKDCVNHLTLYKHAQTNQKCQLIKIENANIKI